MYSKYYKGAKFYFTLTLLIFVNSCTFTKNSSEDQNGQSKVKKIAGVYIFIMSEPTASYEKLGDMRFGWYDKVLSLSSKSISQVSAEILASLSFDKNLNNSINAIKVKFPDVEGVVFDDDMSNCTVIKFKR